MQTKSKSIVEVPPNMKVIWTDTALINFLKLVKPELRKKLEETALATMKGATEYNAISLGGKAKRLIIHNGDEVRFFKLGNFRLVVKDDKEKGEFKFITVEEIVSRSR